MIVLPQALDAVGDAGGEVVIKVVGGVETGALVIGADVGLTVDVGAIVVTGPEPPVQLPGKGVPRVGFASHVET